MSRDKNRASLKHWNRIMNFMREHLSEEVRLRGQTHASCAGQARVENYFRRKNATKKDNTQHLKQIVYYSCTMSYIRTSDNTKKWVRTYVSDIHDTTLTHEPQEQPRRQRNTHKKKARMKQLDVQIDIEKGKEEKNKNIWKQAIKKKRKKNTRECILVHHIFDTFIDTQNCRLASSAGGRCSTEKK